MIILGLGSNIGNRLHYLRLAIKALENIKQLTITHISPVYISEALLPPAAEAHWDMPYLNLALLVDTILSPQELLKNIKQVETDIGRTVEKRWGPRVIDIDILAWGNEIYQDEHLHIPHKNLTARPFALWPLADLTPEWIFPLPGEFQGKTAYEIVARWGSRFSGQAPLKTRQIAQRADMPQLMGILNITPDSYSDGGKYLSLDQALSQAALLSTDGAEIIDIGAESTRPGAAPLSYQEEWQRLEPLLNELLKQSKRWAIPPKISIDTYHPETVNKVLELGVDWINDVSGLENPAMREVLLSKPQDIVFMHHLGLPANPQQTLAIDSDPITTVYHWAETQLKLLENLGFNKEKLIFDLGIGFGKTAYQALALLKNISLFKKLGVRLLVGHSRKSFLNTFTKEKFSERDIETAAISLFLAEKNIDYLRVHNIAATARSFKITAALKGRNPC